MSAPLVSFNSEIDDLNEAENMAKATFQEHCCKMIKDIISYSADSCGDLSNLKKQMVTLAESQKEILGLIHAVNEINSLTGKQNLTGEEAASKFDEFATEFVEENDIDDEQKELIDSLDSFINKEQEAGGNENDESELLVTKTTQSYIDPLTKRKIVDPVKSRTCGHAYERESIMKYLSESKKRCPYSGCQSTLGKKDLMDHFVLKMKLSMKEET